MTPLPTVRCDHYDECARRFDELSGRVNSLDERQRSQGESIAALKAQVALAAAVGSLVGGGVVAAVVKLMTH